MRHDDLSALTIDLNFHIVRKKVNMKNIATNIIASIIVSVVLAILLTGLSKFFYANLDVVKGFFAFLITTLVCVPAIYASWTLWKDCSEPEEEQ